MMRLLTPRRLLLLSTLLLAFGVLLLPPPVWAGTCSDPLPDLNACADGMTYGLARSAASFLWWLMKALLSACYWIACFRTWLVHTAFGTLYGALDALFGPLLAPVALVALLLWALIHMAGPLLKMQNAFSLGHILLWFPLSLMLLGHMGTWFGAFDDFRAGLVQDIAAVAAGVTAPAIPSSGETVMAADRLSEPDGTSALYPSTMCGGNSYDRGTTGSGDLDNLVGRYLFADAEDIHCTHEGDPSATDIPDAWYDRIRAS